LFLSVSRAQELKSKKEGNDELAAFEKALEDEEAADKPSDNL
jgi:hypothetical protein